MGPLFANINDIFLAELIFTGIFGKIINFALLYEA